MKKIIFLFFAALLFYACPLELNTEIKFCNGGWAIFTIPVSFSPADSVIHLGDTITISSTIPDTMRDLDLNTLYRFDSVQFYLHSGFYKIDTFNGTNITSNVNLVDYIIDTLKYDFHKGKHSVIFEYEYKNNEYFIQYKVVPKYKGVYYFDFLSDLQDFNDLEMKDIYAPSINCKTKNWALRFTTNNGINNHKELLKHSPIKRYNTDFYDDWQRRNDIWGTHCFKVE